MENQNSLQAELLERLPSRPPRPNPAIEIDSAVSYIRWHANALQRHLLGNGKGTLLESDEKDRHMLQTAVHDCGWCIYIQYSDEGLAQLAEAATLCLINPYRFELKHLIDHSFHGIGLWKTYGELWRGCLRLLANQKPAPPQRNRLVHQHSVCHPGVKLLAKAPGAKGSRCGARNSRGTFRGAMECRLS